MKNLVNKKFNFKINKGFTFLEVVITIGILFTILGLITINLLNTRNRASLSTTVDLLITDIQNQQLKSLSANTEGRSTLDDYGVLIENTSYTLFHGTYTSGAPTNIVFQIDTPLSLSTSFPNSQVIFIKSTGEISNFANGQNTITIEDTSQNISKTIHFNSLGVITNVD